MKNNILIKKATEHTHSLPLSGITFHVGFNEALDIKTAQEILFGFEELMHSATAIISAATSQAIVLDRVEMRSIKSGSFDLILAGAILENIPELLQVSKTLDYGKMILIGAIIIGGIATYKFPKIIIARNKSKAKIKVATLEKEKSENENRTKLQLAYIECASNFIETNPEMADTVNDIAKACLAESCKGHIQRGTKAIQKIASVHFSKVLSINWIKKSKNGETEQVYDIVPPDKIKDVAIIEETEENENLDDYDRVKKSMIEIDVRVINKESKSENAIQCRVIQGEKETARKNLIINRELDREWIIKNNHKIIKADIYIYYKPNTRRKTIKTFELIRLYKRSKSTKDLL